jgi:anthranilate phosphoribosyltransferase
MGEILSGQATDAQIAGFVTALRAKGETRQEVTCLVDVMLEHSLAIRVDGPVLDIVGTGGDHSGSVNISTMASVVAAACGARVIKHGNRAVSSQTGTADVLEELGVAIALQPEQVARCAAECGIAFAFAPVHHPAMRHAAAARRELGIPTVFNILGPLSNPAGARAALIGCADAQRAPLMAEVLADRGVRALVVRGEDGLDEISTCGPTTVWDASGAGLRVGSIDPVDLGIEVVSKELLEGGDRARNASLARMALGSIPTPEAESARVQAIRDAVALNAAAALVVLEAGPGSGDGGVMAAITEALPRAREALHSGLAAGTLAEWIRVSQRLAG